MEIIINQYKDLRLRLYNSRYNANIITKIGLSICFACLTGLLAQVRITLPWTPVPITGQTFAVLLSGIALGRWGAISQLIYILIGLVGAPWFSGGKAGIAAVFGPTGGYLIGFIFASYFIGYLLDEYSKFRKIYMLIIIMLIANFAFIYGCGLVVLNMWLAMVKGSPVEFYTLLSMGMIPYVTGDIIKAVLAAISAYALIPENDS